ncbi:MAG: hypothetical protein J6M16_02455 [Clostridia bacterium]|nr:hypothetical protein [Clostridia bacterium]
MSKKDKKKETEALDAPETLPENTEITEETKEEKPSLNIPSLISPAINLIKAVIELVKELIDDAKHLRVTSFFFIGAVAFFTAKSLKNKK